MGLFSLILVVVLLTGCSTFKPIGEQTKLLADIEQQQLFSMQQANKELLLLDVRSEEEFNQGHISGAINIAHKELAMQLTDIKDYQHKNIVVYCRSGRRAAIAQAILTDNGFTKVNHLNGDFMAWQQAERPIQKNKG